MCTSKSSPPASDRNSSRTGKPLFGLADEESHEDEKMDDPNALERPLVGRVKDSERRRLFVGTEVVTEAECRKFGRAGARLVTGLGLETGGIWRWNCSVRDSAEPGRLVSVLEAAANRWAASWTLEGRVHCAEGACAHVEARRSMGAGALLELLGSGRPFSRLEN